MAYLCYIKKNIICSSSTIKHHNESKFIRATFNEGSRKAIHIITLYGSHATSVLAFISILEQLINEIPLIYSTIILGDFYLDLCKETNQKKRFRIT